MASTSAGQSEAVSRRAWCEALPSLRFASGGWACNAASTLLASLSASSTRPTTDADEDTPSPPVKRATGPPPGGDRGGGGGREPLALRPLLCTTAPPCAAWWPRRSSVLPPRGGRPLVLEPSALAGPAPLAARLSTSVNASRLLSKLRAGDDTCAMLALLSASREARRAAQWCMPAWQSLSRALRHANGGRGPPAAADHQGEQPMGRQADHAGGPARGERDHHVSFGCAHTTRGLCRRVADPLPPGGSPTGAL